MPGLRDEMKMDDGQEPADDHQDDREGGGLIEGAEEEIAQMAKEGFDVVPMSKASELSLNAGDYPELADEAKGADVVLVVAGEKMSAPGEPLTISLKETSVIHGMKSMRPGGGGRFAAMQGALERKGYSAERAGAISAAAGRKKYGNERFQAMAAAGRRRAARERA